MSRFGRVLTGLSSSKVRVLLVAVALAGYVMPWIVNTGAGLSLNGYDLAEWASLNPVTHSTTPEMLPSLMLRGQLTLVVLLLAVYAGKPVGSKLWWLCALCSAALVIAQFPPFEFFTVARSDTNYRQQFMLAVVSLVSAGLLLTGVLNRWQTLVSVVLGLVGIVGSINGYAQSAELMRGFLLTPSLGIGVVVMVFCYGLSIVGAFKRK